MAALWRARPGLDFRYRHDPEDSDWEEEDGWEHPWGEILEGSLVSWRREDSVSEADSSESSWDGSSDSG